MMGWRERGQGQFFYAFDLDKVVPADHLVRQIDGVLDLDWVHKELAPYYSHTGRPSIDPVLMIRMLLVGYVFAIRSERQLCSETFGTAADAAFHDIAHVEITPHLLGFRRLAFVGKHGIARAHDELGKAAERGNDVFGQPVAEIIILALAERH